MECKVTSGKCRVRSVKCGVWSVKCGVWSVEWNVSKHMVMQPGWNVTKCHACHAKRHDNLLGNIRKGQVFQLPP